MVLLKAEALRKTLSSEVKKAAGRSSFTHREGKISHKTHFEVMGSVVGLGNTLPDQWIASSSCWQMRFGLSVSM